MSGQRNNQVEIDDKTREMLQNVTGEAFPFAGAFNIRLDSGCAGRQNSANIQIAPKTDKPGIDIRISGSAKGEKVLIPACVTRTGIDDLVYNDFYVEEGADVVIVAGCGVHADEGGEARHNGIHRFFIGKGARVLYKEKHLGSGRDIEGVEEGADKPYRKIDPVTEAFLEDDAVFEMDTVQIEGVDATSRVTKARVGARAKLIIRERILTSGKQTATTDFAVDMEGEDSASDIVSRSVAKGKSRQKLRMAINGHSRCTGHAECDAILSGQGTVLAEPALYAGHLDASLIHEAAIGKIAGEQITKLRTFGLTEEEAESRIIEGFLKG